VPAAGRILGLSGPVVQAGGLESVAGGETVRVGPSRLLGEVLNVGHERATIQVYEETAGLRVGDDVVPTGSALTAQLGPGLLGGTFDGLQRPLDRLAREGAWTLAPGLEADALDRNRRWRFVAQRRDGQQVSAGDVLGTVPEGPIEHRVLVPPDWPAGIIQDLADGEFSVDEVIGRVRGPDRVAELTLAHTWPVRRPRPTTRRLPVAEPLLTGQRIIDMLFPLGRGSTAVIPGGFGTGKTVVEQTLARWSDADIVVYVGCGERGNEMAELLVSFPELIDPRTGDPLLDRTVLIANTSNMPVAARESSIQLGVTIAEYFRDQGHAVLLLADSTSRWAEALREISGRLEELPGEEGYPAYLGSRLASFYERAGRVVPLGEPQREGSLTIVGAVSPPGGDFSEPVTQASLRLAATFWALDTELAHARHFPAIGWTQSYSLPVPALASAYHRAIGSDWLALRGQALALLGRERQLLDIVQLVGPEALPDEDRVVLEQARLMRETFLRQHAFDPIDASRPARLQIALLRAVLAAGEGMRAAIERGVTVAAVIEDPLLAELRRANSLAGPEAEVVARIDALTARLREWHAPAEHDVDVPGNRETAGAPAGARAGAGQ
jgi:V/A-type H+-transporting ATPase subunit A